MEASAPRPCAMRENGLLETREMTGANPFVTPYVLASVETQ